MKGWLADLFRLAWAFPYWNARKTLYRWRGARRTCPCQSPSDSGKAHVTGCEAAFDWHRPERFRRVCPLLERGSDGRWCCSVNAAEVRPFWGLAARAAGLAGLTGLLIASIGAWTGLRVIGYPVSFRQVVWPPAWREVNTVRSEHFLDKARAAYTAGHIKEAMLSLTLAYQLNPGNYAAGMMLAQFRQADNPILADTLYRQLRYSHPDKRAATTQAWLHHLLVHAAYDRVAMLAGEELMDSPHESAWIHALLFACRQMHNPAPLEMTSVRLANLAPEWKEVLEIETATLHGTLQGDDLRRKLRALAAKATNRYVLYYALDRQIAAGGKGDVLAQVRDARGRLPGRAILALGLTAYAQAGDDTGREKEIATLLASRPKLGATEIEVLCAHLIRYPQPASLTALVQAWRRDPATPNNEQVPLYLALYFAAVVGKNDDARVQAENWLQADGKTLPHVLTARNQAPRNPEEINHISLLLMSLPILPLEITYAILERSAPIDSTLSDEKRPTP